MLFRSPKALQQGRERRGLENLVVAIHGILIGRTLAVENVTLVLDGSSNRGSTTMRARHGPPESSRELGTLEHGSTFFCLCVTAFHISTMGRQTILLI